MKKSTNSSRSVSPSVLAKAAELALSLENLRDNDDSAKVLPARARIEAALKLLGEYLKTGDHTKRSAALSSLLATMSEAEIAAAMEQLTFELQETVHTAVDAAQLAAHRRVIFGDQKPSAARLRKWLKTHQGDDFPSEEKVLIARAIQHFRKELNIKLLFTMEAGKTVECTLSTAPQMGDYPRRFRLMACDAGRTPIYQRNVLPPLEVEPR